MSKTIFNITPTSEQLEQCLTGTPFVFKPEGQSLSFVVFHNQEDEESDVMSEIVKGQLAFLPLSEGEIADMLEGFSFDFWSFLETPLFVQCSDVPDEKNYFLNGYPDEQEQ